MLEIDGASGGGSILRIGVGLSVASGIPVRIKNIRKARSESGLKHQHLAGLLAAASLCEARLTGAELGSQEIEFYPDKIKKEKIKIEIPTAGAIGLALQPLQIAALKIQKPLEVEIEGGGTFGQWAPPTPYLEQVNFAILERLGYKAKILVERHGFYPKGGAKAKAKFYPPAIEGPISLEEKGRLLMIKGVSVASNHLRPAQVAERQANTALSLLRREFPDLKIDINSEYHDTRSPGSAVVLWAIHEHTIIGADALGERGKRSEQVGAEAAQDLINTLRSEATLDPHMADQIIPFLGIYGGAFRYAELTEHMKTNIMVVENFTGKSFEVNGGRISFNLTS